MKKRMAIVLMFVFCLFALSALADDLGVAVVCAPSGRLHLREEPSSESASLGLFFTGTEVVYRSSPYETWVEVKIGSETGYMYGDYLRWGAEADRVRPAWQTGTVSATNWARLRSGASTDYEFLCKVNNGATVTVMGETANKWYYVQYRGETGFISANLVNLHAAAPQQPSYQPSQIQRPQQPTVTAKSWREAYRAWLLQNGDAYHAYSLIFVNNDNVPELAVSTGAEAGGCQILTFAGGRIDVLQTRRLNFSYIKKGNLLLNSDGHMDSYFDDVYRIENGRWRSVASGESYGYTSTWSDVLGRFVCRNYSWNGQNTTMERYMSALAQVYDEGRSSYAPFDYSYEEIMALLGN